MGCLLSFLRTGTFNFRFFGAAKRDRERQGSVENPEEECRLDDRSDDKHSEEELAACKIQAGFRGYKTRKNLKTKKSKGDHLSLTSLTPLANTKDGLSERFENETEEELEERKRLEKAEDEAIAAEIKTPLETIREESIDGSLRIKTPESKHDTSKTGEGKAKSIDLTDTLEEMSEQDEEKINLQEIREHLSEEIGNISMEEDSKESQSLELDLNDESDADKEMMEFHINEVLKPQPSNDELVEIIDGLGEDDQTSASQSLETMDLKEASVEIHESEVETMMVESDKGGESELETSENRDHHNETETRDQSVLDTNEDTSSCDKSDSVNNENPSQKLPVDVELPSLSPICKNPSFANTDSASSYNTTVCPVDFKKKEDSSQDASSLSETPLPQAKPRKPASASLDESKLGNLSEDKENFGDTSSSFEAHPQPVLRRQKTSPKNRGKAVASKYRSGIVMDDEVSMEEMEAQIESEMLSQAATKIQAGFRGYKTRKTIGKSGGVSRAKLISGEKVVKESPEIAPPLQTDPAEAVSVLSAFATASASADSLSFMGEREKPTLGYLRSRSYPGSRDKEEGAASQDADESADPNLSEIELEYDPAYVNKAAVKIQANVRGYLVRSSMKRNKKRASHQKSISETGEQVSFVHFDVGDVDTEESAKNDRLELGESDDVVNPYGELIINPADRRFRDSISPMSDAVSEVSATKIQAAFRGYRDRQQVRQTKKAVVTIQATVRGFLTRRRLMKLRRRSFQRRRSSAKSMMMSPEVQKIQKANDAATKIQAVYRGYQVRSKIRKIGSDDE